MEMEPVKSTRNIWLSIIIVLLLVTTLGVWAVWRSKARTAALDVRSNLSIQEDYWSWPGFDELDQIDEVVEEVEWEYVATEERDQWLARLRAVEVIQAVPEQNRIVVRGAKVTPVGMVQLLRTSADDLLIYCSYPKGEASNIEQWPIELAADFEPRRVLLSTIEAGDLRR